MAYRLEFFMGIVNTIITTVVYLCIYWALYGGAEQIDGVSFGMVATNFVISLGLSNAFSFNEMFLQDKVKDGSITNEFLKPVNFKLRMLAQNMGGGLFNLIFNFLSALLFGIIFTDFCAPYSVLNLGLMIVSVLLGYLILWQISFLVQTWCFWLFSVWGIVTIKNVCPGKRVALAAILTEVDDDGMEYQRGMKAMTIPAHNHSTCRDILVKCIKFVVPEDLDVSGGSTTAMCNKRNFKARFIAHNIDTDYRCCESVLTL